MSLYDLACAAVPAGNRARQQAPRSAVRPSVARIVNGIPGLPAFLMNNRLDTMAARYERTRRDSPSGRGLCRAPDCALPQPNYTQPASRRQHRDGTTLADLSLSSLPHVCGTDGVQRELRSTTSRLCRRSTTVGSSDP
jgi:hypothetical protein